MVDVLTACFPQHLPRWAPRLAALAPDTAGLAPEELRAAIGRARTVLKLTQEPA
jgi:hypothetical protein